MLSFFDKMQTSSMEEAAMVQTIDNIAHLSRLEEEKIVECLMKSIGNRVSNMMNMFDEEKEGINKLLEEKECKIFDLAEQLRISEVKIDEQELEKNMMGVTTADLKRQLDMAKMTIQDLNTKLRISEVKIDEQELEKNMMGATTADLKKQVDTFIRAWNGLKSTNQSLKTENADYIGAIKDLTEEKKMLMAKCDELTSNIQGLKAKNAHLDSLEQRFTDEELVAPVDEVKSASFANLSNPPCSDEATIKESKCQTIMSVIC